MTDDRASLIDELRSALGDPSDLEGLVMAHTDQSLEQMSEDDIRDLIYRAQKGN